MTSHRSHLYFAIIVYHITERNIYIIQQRSPTVLGKQCSFSNSLHDLLTSLQYATALLITGASREEVEIAGGGLFHIASPDARKAIETEYPLFVDVLSNKTKAMASSVSNSFIPYGMALSSLLWRASATSFIPLAPAGGESLMDPMMVHAPASVFTGTSKAAAAETRCARKWKQAAAAICRSLCTYTYPYRYTYRYT